MTLSIFKDNNHQIQEKFVSVSIIISVLLISIDYIYELHEYQVFLIYLFDFIVVILLSRDFHQRMCNHKGKKIKFFIKHLYELPAMVPVFVFGLMDTQTILTTNITIKSLEILTLLRLVHIYFRAIVIFRNHHFLHLVMLTLGTIVAGGFSVYYFESHHKDESSVDTLENGLWLIVSTMTTVGYGDFYPITTEGKIIASLTMFVGIAILWVFISTIGTSLVQGRIKQQRPISSNIHGGRKGTKSEETVETQPFSITEQMRDLIITRINNIDKLNDKEVEVLIDTIRNLHKHSRNKN